MSTTFHVCMHIDLMLLTSKMPTVNEYIVCTEYVCLSKPESAYTWSSHNANSLSAIFNCEFTKVNVRNCVFSKNSHSVKFSQCDFFPVPKIALCEDPVYLVSMNVYGTKVLTQQLFALVCIA